MFFCLLLLLFLLLFGLFCFDLKGEILRISLFLLNSDLIM